VGTEDEAAARAFFETRFSAYRIVAPDGATEGLVTGYYEPILKARRARASGFRYPIYGVPDDLVVVDLADLHPELRNLRLRIVHGIDVRHAAGMHALVHHKSVNDGTRLQ